MTKKYCVYKVSPSGIKRPLYYGSEDDCRGFCEKMDYEFVDDENVVWYLEIDSRPAESEETLVLSQQDVYDFTYTVIRKMQLDTAQ